MINIISGYNSKTLSLSAILLLRTAATPSFVSDQAAQAGQAVIHTWLDLSAIAADKSSNSDNSRLIFLATN